MAVAIPDSVAGTGLSFKRVWRHLRTHLPDELTIRAPLCAAGWHPDLVVEQPRDNRWLLLWLNDATPAEFHTTGQPGTRSLFANDEPSPLTGVLEAIRQCRAELERRVDRHCVPERLHKDRGGLPAACGSQPRLLHHDERRTEQGIHDGGAAVGAIARDRGSLYDVREAGNGSYGVPVGIVCVHLGAEQVAELAPPLLQEEGVLLWSWPALRDKGAGDLESHMVRLEESEEEEILSGLFPELEVHAAVRASVSRMPAKNGRDTSPRLQKFFLSLDQERASKVDLALPAQQRAATRDFSVRLVNGVAGSGKTLILLHRARLLAELFPQQKVLFLVHNRPIARELEGRLRRLTNGSARNVEVRTFFGWCTRYLGEVRPVSAKKRAELIAATHRNMPTPRTLSEGQLQAEIDFIKDRVIFTPDDYLQTDRSGLGFPLGEKGRRQVFAALTHFDDQVAAMNKRDWADVPRMLWRKVAGNQVRLDTYDHVLIDEAQFFAPIWFELVKMAIAPRGGQLFMAADPNQGFLQRKLSWLKAGLEVRGRTLRLHRSYRTTREILQAATQFLRAVTGFDQEAVAPDYRAMPRGEKPVLMEADTPQDEVTRVANEIAELAKQGVALHHILVIHAWPIIKDQLANELERMLGQGKVRDLNDRADHGLSCDDAVRLVSLNSATGLEAPVVFLTGVGQVFEAERSLRKTEAEHQEARETNARRLHMAMTRAGQLMVLSTSGPIPPELTVAGVRQDHSG